MIMMLSLMMLSGSAMAQESQPNGQDSKVMRPKRVRMTQEQMTSTTWTKSVTIPLAAKAGLNIQPTLKGEVSEGEYTIAAKGQMAYTWLDQDGQQLSAGSIEKTPEMEAVFYADGIGQYLGAITANCYVARAFGKDYSVTDTDISWGGNAGDDNTQGTGISDDGATDDNR